MTCQGIHTHTQVLTKQTSPPSPHPPLVDRSSSCTNVLVRKRGCVFLDWQRPVALMRGLLPWLSAAAMLGFSMGIYAFLDSGLNPQAGQSCLFPLPAPQVSVLPCYGALWILPASVLRCWNEHRGLNCCSPHSGGHPCSAAEPSFFSNTSRCPLQTSSSFGSTRVTW